VRALPFVLSALLAVAPTSVVGQERATIDRAEYLARAGRTEEARVELLRWWEGEYRDASRQNVQRGLWLRGSLTVDPAQAEIDFRRLVVEYPGGPYSGQALLRLAQSALAKGDSASAVTHARRLVVEYPIAAGRQEAEEWLARVEPLLHEEAPPSPRVLAAAVDTTPPVTRDSQPPRDTVGSVGSGSHGVQLGAFSGEDRARALHRAATDAGLEARLVRIPGSDLLRVRVGVFGSTEEAAAASRRIQQMGFAVAVVGNVDIEERVAR
jgi:cell division septation protein DedD